MPKKKSTTKPVYSVLTYNVNGYEILHEIPNPSPMAEYIYVTDDKSITSNTWKIIYVDNPYDDPFELCYQIRFNPFNYVNTNIVVRIDGSMSVTGDLDSMVKFFIDNNYDIALSPHPTRNQLIPEYNAWIKYRNYTKEQAVHVLTTIKSIFNFDVLNYKALFQYNFMIQKNNKINNNLNNITLSLLHFLAPQNKSIERIDQTVGSFVFNHFISILNPNTMLVPESVCDGSVFTWFQHNSNNKLSTVQKPIQPFLFNKPTTFSYPIDKINDFVPYDNNDKS